MVYSMVSQALGTGAEKSARAGWALRNYSISSLLIFKARLAPNKITIAKLSEIARLFLGK